MEKTWTIYIHKCKTTGKCYVGQTCKPLYRRWGHGSQYTKTNNLKFYNAIQKYGWEDFEHYILDQCSTQEEAYELEQFYIDLYDTFKNGYNSTLGGLGSKGRKMTEETKEKLRKANKGKPTWISYIPKDKQPMYGRHHTEETKRKISIANRGRTVSQESREKMRLAKLGKTGAKRSEETKEKMRQQKLGSKNHMYGKHTNNKPNSYIPVIQYDKDGNFIKEYIGMREAQRQTGVRADNIRHSIERKGTAGGYIWKIKK